MFRLRKASDRGKADRGWLDSRFSFSFAEYHDPDQMGFRALRVINEDRVAPGQGFGSHPHRDMEILSYVLEGQLEHRDSLDNGAVIGPGEFQRITAGTGIVHSEFNPSRDAPVHFYQVWIKPRAKALAPSYEERKSGGPTPDDRLELVASPDGRDGSMTIQQEAEVWLGRLSRGVEVTHPIGEGRGVWLQLLRGAATAGKHELTPGDGLAIEDEPAVTITTPTGPAELLLFDLP